jgi:hypothetical protein
MQHIVSDAILFFSKEKENDNVYVTSIFNDIHSFFFFFC